MNLLISILIVGKLTMQVKLLSVS